ncbi:dTMP kinase [Chloroflexota bacterium]
MVEQMKDSGFPCEYVYSRLDTFLLTPFMVIAQKLFLRGKKYYGGYGEYSSTKRKAIRKYPLLSHIYQWLLLFDYSLQILIKVKLPLMRGRNLICDRYVYDTVITDLAVDFDYSQNRVKQVLRRLFRLFPRPQLTFLLDVPEEIAYSRKDDVPSMEYLRERRSTYLDIGRELRMTILDGSKTQTEVQSEAKEEISRLALQRYPENGKN